MPRVSFADLHRDDQADLKRAEDKPAIGGMRGPRRAVNRLPRLKIAGKVIGKIVDNFIQDHPHVIEDCLKALGNDKHTGPSPALVQKLKDEILRVIGKSPTLAEAKDGVRTELDAEF